MFWVRFVSSILLIIIFATSLIIGGGLLFGLMSAVSLIGLIELYGVFKVDKSILAFVGYLASVVYSALIYFDKSEFLFPLTVICLLLLMGVYVFCFPKYNIGQIALVFIGLFYVTAMLMFVYQVRVSVDGAYLAWLIFIGSWGSDTCAYLVGMSIGRHKLVKKLSPKKSVEGALGGVLGAALLGFIFAFIIKDNAITKNNNIIFDNIEGFINLQVAFVLISGCASVISQVGDLAASAIKRNYDIKDYGKLIPGHGWILDRFDSVIFTAPVVYFLSVLLW